MNKLSKDQLEFLGKILKRIYDNSKFGLLAASAFAAIEVAIEEEFKFSDQEKMSFHEWMKSCTKDKEYKEEHYKS